MESVTEGISPEKQQQEIVQLYQHVITLLADNSELNQHITKSWLRNATVAMPRFGTEDNRFRVITYEYTPWDIANLLRREAALKRDAYVYQLFLQHGEEKGMGKNQLDDATGVHFHWETSIEFTKEVLLQAQTWSLSVQRVTGGLTEHVVATQDIRMTVARMIHHLRALRDETGSE